MAKEKQEPDKPVPEDSLISLLKEMQSGIGQINSNVQQLGKNDKILSDRMDNMEKNPPKKDILTQGIEVINAIDKTGLFEMLGDALGGGDKQDAINTSQVPPEGYEHYVKFTKSMQDLILSNQTESVRSMKLQNDLAEKKLGADY